MGLFSKIKQAVSGVGDIGQDIIDTGKDIVNTVKRNPLTAAALIGAGYYFAPQLGAWFNSATGEVIAGTAAGTAEGAAAVNLGTATAADLAMAFDPVAANIAAGMTPEAAAAAAAKTAAVGNTTLGALGTGAAIGAGTAGLAGLTAAQLGQLGLLSGGLNLIGGLAQGSTTKDALSQLATQQAALAEKTMGMGKFQPVGVTTRFGTSGFVTDPTTGAITPSYTLSPESQAYQTALGGLATQGLQAGQGLMSLGQQYIGESPEAVRQRYIETQRALLAPGQEQQLAAIRNNLFQTGRSGLSTGATTAGGMAATNPEMAAYYNALANTERQLAANAETQYQNQVNFGTGLLGQATTPFTNVFGAQKNIELAAQQPLELSTNFANIASTRGAAQGANYAQAMAPSLQAQYNAANYNPLATAFQGAGNNPLTTYGLLKLATG